jgi:Disulphide bond corrector protein DsbC
MKRCMLVLAGLMGLALPAIAEEITASPWLDFREAKVRLVAVHHPKSRNASAAIEIRLAPGYKTYWRTAGDSGVPPVFDFTASPNATVGDVAFPFPSAFDDGAGGKAWGYKERVLLRFDYRRLNVDLPAHLTLKLDFAVCGTLCVPLSGRLELSPSSLRITDENAYSELMKANKPAFPADCGTYRGPARFVNGALMPEKPEERASSPGIREVVARGTPGKPGWHIDVDFPNAPEDFAVFPEAKGYLSVSAIQRLGKDRLRLLIEGEAAPGSGGTFGEARLTYGNPLFSCESRVNLESAALP